MSYRIVCSHCRAVLKAAVAPPVGKRVKCPKCSQLFTIGPSQLESPPAAVPPPSQSNPATPSRSVKSLILLMVGVALGIATAGGAYWLFAFNGWQASKKVDHSEEVAGLPPSEVRSQPVQEPVTEPKQAEDSPASLEVDRAHPPIAEAEGRESELKLPMRLKCEGIANSLVFSPDGSLLAAAGTDSGTDGIILFAIGSGKIHRTLPFPNIRDQKVAVEFAPNSLAIAVATTRQLSVWQVSDGRELVSSQAIETDAEFANPSFAAAGHTTFAFSPSGTLFVYSDASNEIHVWDLEEGRERTVLKGHKAPVLALVFTSDGKSLVSVAGDNDRTVRLWSIQNPSENRVLIDGLPITLLAVAPDGKTLFTGPEVMQWEIAGTGPAVSRGKFSENDAAVYADQLRLLLDGKTLAIRTHQETKLWDIEQLQVRHSLKFPMLEGNAPLKQVVVSPDGQTVATAAETVQLWDLVTGQMRTRIKEDQSEFWPELIAFSADSAVLAVSFPDGLINLVPASGEAGSTTIADAKAILRHDFPVGNIAFNADDKLLVAELLPPLVNPEDPAIHPDFEAIVKANKDLLTKLGTTSDNQLKTKVFSELNEKLFRAFYDKFEPRFHWGDVASVWDLSSNQERIRLKQPSWGREEFLSPSGLDLKFGFKYDLGEHRNPVPTAVVGGDRVAWLNRLAGVQLYDVITDQHLQIDSFATAPIRAKSGRVSGQLESWQLSPNGDVLLVSSVSRINHAGGTSNVYDCYLVDLATTRTVPIELNSKNSLGAQQVCFSPDGVTFAAALTQADGTDLIRTWDVATGRESTPRLSIVAKRPRELAISPHGQTLAFVEDRTAQGELRLVDLITGKGLPAAVPGSVDRPTFSPDNETLAVITDEGRRQTPLLVDLKTGQVRTRITDFMSESVGELLFALDGKALVVASGVSDRQQATQLKRKWAGEGGPRSALGEIKMFDAATGKLLAVLGGHTGEISDIAVTLDGRLLASSSWDKTVRIWDLKSAGTKTEVAARTVPRPPTKPILAATRPSTKSSSAVVASSKEANPEEPAPSSTPAQTSSDATAAATRSKQGKVSHVNTIGMEFVPVPAGAFQMGSPETDPAAEPYERPSHRVRITKPFAIGKYEVTVGQFRVFVQETGHQTDAERDGVGGFGYDIDARQWGGPAPRFTWKNIGAPQTDDHPVVNVSWEDANAFCSWLTAREGQTYRLPTEAEWEYACRAGTKTRFWTGDRIETLHESENVGDVSLKLAWEEADWVADWNDGHAFTAPVGSYKANPWGLFDMHGNVTEWTQDWFDEKFYEQSPADDPTGPTTGDRPIHRGGNWYTPPSGARAAIRFALASPSDRSDGWGFRVVRDP